MANNVKLSYPSAFYHQFFDSNGKPLTCGKLYTYSAGTNTPIPTYKTIGDTSSTNTNTNPIILDNAGMAYIVIETDRAYKFVLFDKNDAKIAEWDNVTGNIGDGGGSSVDIVVVGTPNEIDVSGSVTQGVKRYVISLSNSVKSTILYLVGLYNNVLNLLGNKADKVQGATAGNLAALDASGNLTDSGSKVADFKTKQTPVTDPSASGAGLEFIDSVSQDANGVITPHKKTVQDGTTSQKGVVQLNNAIDSTSTTEAATPKAVKDAYDALNAKIVARAVFLSQQEWAAQSLLPGDPAKVYYVENGTGEDAYTVYVWKESTSTYEEVDESSIDLDGYWHDAPTTTGNGNVVTDVSLGNDGVPVLTKGITALTQHQSVSDSDPTLAWGTRSKVGSVGGTELHVTMPSNPASGKADKVSGATSGNLAGLDANGNLTDSGKKASDFEPSFSVLPISKGGTGKTTGKAATNNLFSDINNVNTDPDDTARIIFKYGSPSDSNGIFFAREITNLWNYINSKIASVLGLSENGYTGNAATATNATNATNATTAAGYTNDGAIANALSGKQDALPSISGKAGQVLKVNSGATGLEWATDNSPTVDQSFSNPTSTNPVSTKAVAEYIPTATALRTMTMFEGSSSSLGYRVHTYGYENTNNQWGGWRKVATITRNGASYNSARVCGRIYSSGSNWAQYANYCVEFQIRCDFVTPAFKIYHTPSPNVSSLIRLVCVSATVLEIQANIQGVSTYTNYVLYAWNDLGNNVSVAWEDDLSTLGTGGTVETNAYEIDTRKFRLANGQVGSTSQPVYVDSNGQVRPCTVLSGGTSNFDRTFTTTFTVGSTDQYITMLIKNDNNDLIADYVTWHNANYGKLSSPPMIIISVFTRETDVSNPGLISLNMYRNGNGCDVFGEQYTYMGNKNGSRAYNTQYFTDQTFVSGSAYYLNIRNETPNTMWTAGTILDISIRIVAHAVSVT